MKKLLITTAILLASISTTAHSKMVHYNDINNYPKVIDLYKRYDTTPQPYVFKTDKQGFDLIYKINKEINERISYKNEPQGKDYWQLPSETNKLRTGDCEDYAIAKWYELLQNGIPERDMTLLQGISGFEFHAILQVYYEGKFYYLDNNTNDITVNNIKPLGSYNINRFGVTYYIEGN